MTGKDLAEKVGVSPVAVSNIASGNSFPKPDLLKSIADALDVDIRELFNPTKEAPLESTREALYIRKNGDYIGIGEIDLSSINEG
ncbi:helix-turn-helix transcriptional regulator [Antarcticibacterium sp. 1MA-6-2]|uniref:helix-turn-helix domain-containing protein n=1 Tax=Antarcticibacterium sp. 1MA-6-2 TaxID=2908210 RepID=UPI001F34886A|nr:helix-turn-helix transcriptional regulator [Antarcticibacterium sp. 1MA-6-2]UJH91684.1 helix-turn-helix transcriptional regulator [Antarcticibacterium sp. 1MA-6-2]